MNLIPCAVLDIGAAMTLLLVVPKQSVSTVVALIMTLSVGIAILMAAEQGRVNVDINLGNPQESARSP